MAELVIRAATQADASHIRALIRLVRINPMSLDWTRFLVASSADGRLAACAQIKPHADGTCELASLAVHPDFRGRGLARALVERLLAGSPRPLYLTCRSGLGPLYEKFGFRPVSRDELTPYFRRIQKLAHRMMSIFGDGETLLVMRLDS